MARSHAQAADWDVDSFLRPYLTSFFARVEALCVQVMHKSP